MQDTFICPHCGKQSKRYRNPIPTVDIIIQIEDRLFSLRDAISLSVGPFPVVLSTMANRLKTPPLERLKKKLA